MGRIIDMPLPRLGETMEEGRIGQVLKKPGERFRRGETLLEVESDKTTVEVPALQDGVLVEWLVNADDMVPVESAIARIEVEGEAVSEAKAKTAKPAAASAPATAHVMPASSPSLQPQHRTRASTAARAAARRAGIDLSTLTGSGRNDRITRDDLAKTRKPLRATYLLDGKHGKIFLREWTAQSAVRGTVFLIHGLFSDSQSFTTLGRKLAALGYRTLAADLPGHGETQSAAKSLDEIVADIDVVLPPGPLRLVGHSFGAIVATRLAQKAQSLTLLAPAGCGENINGTFVDAMLAGHVDQALGFLGETAIPPEAVASLTEHLSVGAGQLRAIAGSVTQGSKQTVSILSRLSQCACPVTAVFCRNDAVIPAEQALDLPPNVALRMIQSGSHLPHWREPDLVAKLIG